MEPEGHPTQDLIDELSRRGAALYRGTAAGPDDGSLSMAGRREPHEPGFWLFVPVTAWETEIDEPPAI